MSRTKQERREVPCGTGYAADTAGTRRVSLVDTHTMYDTHRPPASMYEAVMVADFDEQPRIPQSSFLEEMETAAGLTERERAVLAFTVYGGLSLRVAGQYLGAEFPRKGIPKPYTKPTVAAWKQRAINKLRDHIERTEYVEFDLGI